MHAAVVGSSTHVWSVPEVRPNQIKTATHLIDPSKTRSLLIIDRTGSGKTHIYRIVGTIERGVILIIVPLLTLSADQLSKFKGANQSFGSVTAHHIDELFKESVVKYTQLLNSIRMLKRQTTSTIYLFVSPQFIINHVDFRMSMINAARERIMRVVGIDEFHLYVQQGMSFRSEIRRLKNAFWIPIFQQLPPNQRPKFFAASATVYSEYVQLLTSLTTIAFPPNTILRGPPADFAQRNISTIFVNRHSRDHTRQLDRVVTFVKDNPLHSACVFCVSKQRSYHLAVKLEEKLDKAKLDQNVDVIHVHGSLLPEEKYVLIRIFCQKHNLPHFAPRILLATAAANVGIDNHNVLYILMLGWPRDLCTYFQQRGRAARLLEQIAIAILVADVSSYLSIIYSIYTTTETSQLDDTGDDSNELVGINSAISPLKQKTKPSSNKTTSKSLYKLSSTEQQALERRSLSEMIDLLRYHVLDVGCQSIRGELFLSSGELDCRDAISIDYRPCVSCCPICTKDWHKTFLPVHRIHVVRFLRHMDRKLTPLNATEIDVVDLLWTDKYERWRLKDIFGTTNISKYNVDSLFLQLIATGMIVVTKIDGLLQWTVAERVHISNGRDFTLVCEETQSWVGINLL